MADQSNAGLADPAAAVVDGFVQRIVLFLLLQVSSAFILGTVNLLMYSEFDLPNGE